MRKTLQRILRTGIVLCALNSRLDGPCYATVLQDGQPLPEPNAVAERVEPGYNTKTLALTTVITAIASGLTGLGCGMMYGRRKQKESQ